MTGDVVVNLAARDTLTSRAGLGVQRVFLQYFSQSGQRQPEDLRGFKQRIRALLFLERNLAERRLAMRDRFHGHIIPQHSPNK